MSIQTIFEFQNVSKSYGTKKIFENFNLKLEQPNFQNSDESESSTCSAHKSQPSNIIALLGANGAGKTTFLKMLLGLEVAQKGVVKLYGQNPTEEKSRIHIGATPQELDFPDGLKVAEVLKFVQNHYKNPFNSQKLMDVFKLSEFVNNKASGLSGGQKRRLALALAFIGNPSLVLLDEPTTGLDVIARTSFWNYIKNESQKTILLTTHDLSEIEKVATRLLFLQCGEIVFDGTVAEFKKMHALSSKKISFFAENTSKEALQKIEGAINVLAQDNHYTIECYNSDEFLRALVENRVLFQNLSIEISSLEDSFLNLSQGK